LWDKWKKEKEKGWNIGIKGEKGKNNEYGR
jgi:hypothetical protein